MIAHNRRVLQHSITDKIMNDPSDTTSSTDYWYWDRYWQYDRLAACLQADDANYSSRIRDAWEAFFATCGSGACLLDIGTGNGALPLIAQETAHKLGRTYRIHAVDRADIDPHRFVKQHQQALADIEFKGRVSCEHLPYEPASFDAITGQYALEYMDMPAVIGELLRVAKPGARLRFVIHATHGRTVSSARRALTEVSFLIDELALLEKARELLRTAFAFERAGVPDQDRHAAAQAARKTYQEALHQAQSLLNHAENELMLREMLGLVQHDWQQRRSMTLDGILARFGQLETEVRAHAARLEDLVKAALDEAGLAELSGRFAAAGCRDIQTGKAGAGTAPGDFYGWELSAVKQAG